MNAVNLVYEAGTFWLLCAAVGAAGAVSLRYGVAGAFLAAMCLTFVVYIQWAREQ